MARPPPNLQALFDQVRREYFPRWDRACRWSVVHGEKTPGRDGFCDVGARRIYVADADNTVLLVHEICHAVASPDHGKRFRARLCKVASEARRRGAAALAVELEDEAARYEDAYRPGAASIYGSVEDAFLQRPDLSLDQIEAWLCRDYGMTVEEVRRRFRRLPRVVEDARQRARARARARGARTPKGGTQ